MAANTSAAPPSGAVDSSLLVENSFLRKQVNRDSGSVTVDGRNVTIISASPRITVQEHYLISDDRSFVYRLDVSTDGGRSWNEGQFEMIFRRLE